MRLRKKSGRAVAILAVAALNTGCLFALACAARCSLTSCQRQMAGAAQSACHHDHEAAPPLLPSHQPASCPAHTYLTAAVVSPPVYPVSVSVRSFRHGIVTILAPAPAGIQGAHLTASAAHSPPDVDGRVVCLKSSLLRI